ncbi:Sugar/inositol transporter [Penicillium brevicompactum]
MTGFHDVKKYFNRKLALSCSLIALSSFNYAFDNQGFAQTQAMDAFSRRFGVYDDKTKTWSLDTQWKSYFNGLPYITFACGVVIGSVISSRFGRRWCMFAMGIYALATATITTTSHSNDQILAARILNYVYIGMELSVVPVFQSEIAPTQIRGFVVGSYQLSIVFGGMVIGWVSNGTSKIQDDRAWRIPLGLFFIIPTIISSLIWFIPESPRWLLMQGRENDARVNLHKLREGAFTTDEIEQEFESIQNGLKNEPVQGRFKELFSSSNRKRTAIVLGLNFFQQATGQAFASQYGTLYVKSLHTINAFNYHVINGFIGLCVISVCLYLNDRVGRRPLLLTGAIVQSVALLVMGGLGVHTPSYSEKSAVAAMLSLFTVGFNIGWAALTYVVTTEIPTLRLRDNSQRIASVMNVLTFFAVSFTLPYLMDADYANLQSKVGFIYGSFAIASIVFVYICVPECQGRSFEEIDQLFRMNIPLRKFHKHELPDGVTEIDVNGISKA